MYFAYFASVCASKLQLLSIQLACILHLFCRYFSCIAHAPSIYYVYVAWTLTFVCEFRCILAETWGVAFPLILCPGMLFCFALFFASYMHVIRCSQSFCFRCSPPRMSLSEAEAPGRLSGCNLLLLFVSPVCEDVVGKCLGSACSNGFGLCFDGWGCACWMFGGPLWHLEWGALWDEYAP